MSASSDHHSSGEEGNSTAALNSPPLTQGPYHSFRQLSWTTGQSTRPAGSVSQRGSPGTNDLPPFRSSWGAYGIDPTPFGVSDTHLPPLPSFPSPPSPEVNLHLPANSRQRSAPGQSSSFGARPVEQRGWGSEALITSSLAREGYERYTRLSEIPSATARHGHRGLRPIHNRDEFDGPAQLLPLPLPQQEQSRAQALLELPSTLTPQEQDDIIRCVNDVLSQCAFHFIAKYQFPIPIEPDRRTVRQASDWDWGDWARLLKRLATKRRVPARVLYDGQIKQFVTTIENSLIFRQSFDSRSETSLLRQNRDDRYLLQLISSGLQVAKILQDSVGMEQLNQLYNQSEELIMERRSRRGSSQGGTGSGRPLRPTPGLMSRAVGSGAGIVGGGGGGGGGVVSGGGVAGSY